MWSRWILWTGLASLSTPRAALSNGKVIVSRCCLISDRALLTIDRIGRLIHQERARYTRGWQMAWLCVDRRSDSLAPMAEVEASRNHWRGLKESVPIR